MIGSERHFYGELNVDERRVWVNGLQASEYEGEWEV